MNSAFTACKADFCYYKTTKKGGFKINSRFIKNFVVFFIIIIIFKARKF